LGPYPWKQKKFRTSRLGNTTSTACPSSF
jgi:hypothetical protein